ncbi:sigma 54-interacting transcriptional regulator [Desulfoferula mesophila]|uniref:Hydrogenase n=1 Tax=Desulfoferula mesophila TaxID=3058419 RepID=A0AAU9EAE3_9BACT|nr:hydrogenase [Desulfoferula mesophilus]
MSRDTASRYRLLLEINNAIVKHTDRKTLFQALATEIRKIVPYDRISINIYDPHTKSLSYFSIAEGVSAQGLEDENRPLAKGAIAQEVIRSRRPLIIPDLNQRSYWASVRSLLQAGLTASMAFPLITRGRVLGTIHLSFIEKPADFAELGGFLAELADVVAVAVENMLAHTRLQELNKNLAQQKHYLLEETEDSYGPDSFFYASPKMAEVMRQAALMAASDASVLITGETGTGKEVVARHLHRESPRREALFVKVNCPALSAGLFESELFGHTKGAFTGAERQRVGRFEMAQGGSLLLDEIGELPLHLQAKLLHVLQDKRFERVGDSRTIEVNFRVIAATNRDLEDAVLQKQFRSDLFYRLNTVSLRLPPLRERREDIPLLIRRLTELQAGRTHREPPFYSPQAVEQLQQHSWPGNVRELKNLVKRLLILRPGKTISGAEIQKFLEPGQSLASVPPMTLAEVERQHIERVLAQTGGVLSGENGAAALLGVPRTTLQYRIKKHGINLTEIKRPTAAEPLN